MVALITESRDCISQPRLGYAAETNSHPNLRGITKQMARPGQQGILLHVVTQEARMKRMKLPHLKHCRSTPQRE